MADIIRDIYDPTKLQDTVLFQQKKPIVNYELNLAQDILKNRIINTTNLNTGDNYSGDSFKVYASNLPNEIKITTGTFYHNGRPLWLTTDLTVTLLTTPVTATRTDTVFVEWYIEEISAAMDPTILEPAIGFETARQERINMIVRVAENSSVPTPTSGCYYFTLAKLNRLLGNSYITTAMIVDERDRNVYNFVVSGCSTEIVSGLTFKVNEGDVFVGDTEHYIEDTTPSITATANTTGYVYVDVSGVVQFASSEPTEYHVSLSEIWAGATTLTIIDRRKFRPTSWNYKYGEGETGYPAIIQKFKAGENLAKYDVVYINSANTVLKADATSAGNLPCIGITTQGFSLGQIDNVLVYGEISNTAWTWTVNVPIYLNTSSGLLTQTAPTVAETYVQRVAVALSSTKILFNPDQVYIKNKVAETNFLVLRDDGSIEVMNSSDVLNPTRLTCLASIQNTPNNRGFTILEGNYYINDTESLYLPETTILMGPGQLYETTALSVGWFNKAYFTLDDQGVVKKYESISAVSAGTVSDPVIPDNELPLSLVTYQDDGSGTAGTIINLTQTEIADKRNWLNLGNIDSVSFKPVYRNNTQFIIQNGAGWYNNLYITSSSNILKTANVSSDDTYYIYMDLQSASGGVTSSSFVTLVSSPAQLNQRRYVPLGSYTANAGAIVRSSFFAYNSKYWKYRDVPYEKEQTFISVLGGQTVFSLTSFTFLSDDHLQVQINGSEVYEDDDFTRTPSNIITFAYTVKQNAKVKIRKI